MFYALVPEHTLTRTLRNDPHVTINPVGGTATITCHNPATARMYASVCGGVVIR
jgi:hypothetical protein